MLPLRQQSVNILIAAGIVSKRQQMSGIAAALACPGFGIRGFCFRRSFHFRTVLPFSAGGQQEHNKQEPGNDFCLSHSFPSLKFFYIS